MVFDVPVLTDSRHQQVVTVRVLRPVQRVRRGRRPRVECRQRVGPDATVVELVLVGPAIICNALAIRQSFLRHRV